METPLKLGQLKPLGEYIRQLVLRRDFVQTRVSVLDCLMGEVLADVDVLRTFASPIDMVRLLDACSIKGVFVLVHCGAIDLREAHVAQEIVEVDDLDGHL